MLSGKTVLLCVSGSIAAYKIANLARMLTKENCSVHVIMTKNATNFINPITFETLTSHKCLIDTFDRNFEYSVEHVALAKAADVVLIAPASANVIGKIANGIADDMLTTTVMACPCKKLVSPAMNHNMFHNPIVSDNIKRLEHYGYEIIKPDYGRLANGDMGDGRMCDESVLFDYIKREIAFDKDLKGKNILVSAGATMEAIDPVRYITNHSTGKMGVAIAQNAMLRGANVTLVAGHMEVSAPPFVNTIHVKSANEMADAIFNEFEKSDIVIKAAAVADYTPKNTSDEKIKKSDSQMSIELTRTTDIIATLGSKKRKGQIICGFSMETQNVLENSKKKLLEKNLDLIAANSLKTEGAGFGCDTNVITLISNEKTIELPKMSKSEAAAKILDTIKELQGGNKL